MYRPGQRACRYCAHARLAGRVNRGGSAFYCEIKTYRVRGDYACAAFEREPGADDE